MSPHDLRELISIAIPAPDSDTEAPSLSQLFTPSTHRDALDPDVTLVLGGRGVGKTVWFQSLQQADHRALAADQYKLPRLRNVKVGAGYGTHLDASRYPGPGALKGLLSDFEPELIWQAVCLHALGWAGSLSMTTWAERVAVLESNPALFEENLGEIDRQASGGAGHLILFDALDRMSRSASDTERLVGGLFRVVLDLRTRTRSIRAKVFARPDLAEDQSRFADASKLLANSTELTWTDTNLYGLLFTLLGNAGSSAAERFRSETGDGWREVAPDAWRDSNVVGDRAIQQRVFTAIAGPYMGTNHRRGRTYPWLPSHLADGRGQASPRSFLAAIRAGSEDTRDRRADHNFALHFESIKTGVQRASRIRVAEISEDMPWVAEALKALEPLAVPANEEDIQLKWKNDLPPGALAEPISIADEDVRMGPRNPEDPRALIADLEKLGVMTRRADGRLDVPDVYRVAFGLGRKGGIPRMKNR
jgi:hypothetical protein